MASPYAALWRAVGLPANDPEPGNAVLVPDCGVRADPERDCTQNTMALQYLLTSVWKLCKVTIMTKAVAYYRVSTAKQGSSGLGMEAQRSAVERFCASRSWEIIAPPFTEIESGKRKDRPELAKAIDRALLTGAKLVIAKWDRLTRDLETLVALEKSGVDFIAADNPEANRLTIRLLVVIAQEEREAISARTKAALAAAKARGQRLGNPNGAAAFKGVSGAAIGAATRRRKADEHAARLRDTIASMRSQGITSLPRLAAALNGGGFVTPRGGSWHASSVRNLLARLDDGSTTHPT